jgi:hypothetical protein
MNAHQKAYGTEIVNCLQFQPMYVFRLSGRLE